MNKTKLWKRETDDGRRVECEERDVTRGITWCIDRRTASARAIPATNQRSYLPQACCYYPTLSVQLSPGPPPIVQPFSVGLLRSTLCRVDRDPSVLEASLSPSTREPLYFTSAINQTKPASLLAPSHSVKNETEK